MGLVNQAAFVIPDVLPAHSHAVAGPDWDSRPGVEIVKHEERLAEAGANDEPLMPRRAFVILEDSYHLTGHREDYLGYVTHKCLPSCARPILTAGGKAPDTECRKQQQNRQPTTAFHLRPLDSSLR
jgi:hypothetical protein